MSHVWYYIYMTIYVYICVYDIHIYICIVLEDFTSMYDMYD